MLLHIHLVFQNITVWYIQNFDTSFTLFSGLSEALIGLLERRRGQDGAYIGCMKSGDVISEEYILYYIFFLHQV